jgi:DNA-binding response OmpR family regulator
LKSVGYQVLTAHDGASAVELFTSRWVDGVVLDDQMPGATGDAVASHMKAIKPNVPILPLSGNGELPQEKLQAVDRFLPKGRSTSILLAAIEALLSSSQESSYTSAIPELENQTEGPESNGPPSTTQPEAA